LTFKDELMEILEEEIKELEGIRDLSYKKTDIIMNNEVEALQNMTKEEERLILKIAALEDKRLKLFDSWGVDKNTPFSEVIAKIPEGKEELTEIRDRLNKLFSDIKARNDINNELIKENIEWIEFNMNLITQASSPATYGKKDKNKEPNKSFFDRKV